jgi:hypothetical protein
VGKDQALQRPKIQPVSRILPIHIRNASGIRRTIPMDSCIALKAAHTLFS